MLFCISKINYSKRIEQLSARRLYGLPRFFCLPVKIIVFLFCTLHTYYYLWYHDDGWGTKPAVSDVLTATNGEVKGDPSNYMFFVGDNITTDENKEYYVRATVKGSVAGSMVCNLGTWGKSVEKTLSLTGEYQDVDILLSGVPTATNNHVIFKIGKYVGTVYLKKIEVYEALGANVIKVGEAGFTTFSSTNAFATSDIVTAYGAKYDGSKIV